MQKNYLLSMLLVITFSLPVFSQVPVKGVVTASNNGPVEGVFVKVKGHEFNTFTDNSGNFELLLPDGNYTLEFSADGFIYQLVDVVVINGTAPAVGPIIMQKSNIAVQGVEIPIVTLTESELDEGGGLSGDVSGLLASSSDIYANVAGYQFGSSRYRIRGFDAQYNTISINGLVMNDAESGSPFWSTWGGLNDATRNANDVFGAGFSHTGYGNVGGSTDIGTRASGYSKQTKITYSLANRSYRNRLMATYSTGLMDNGWAFMVSGSRRWATEGYVDGTFYDAYSYFVSAEKRINKRHSINFTGFGAPRKYARAGVASQEAYNLAGSNFYNPYWGYQNGKKRNTRVNDYHKPVLALTHYFTIDNNTKLQTSAAYSFGKGSSTTLDWFTGNDPRPDYYRNMPSYYTNSINDIDAYELALNNWTNDVDTRQINWSHFYTANQTKTDVIENADGILGNTVTGKRSNYILAAQRNDHKQFIFNSVFNKKQSDNLNYNAGINASIYKGYQYKIIDDLLGGDYWLDINKYPARDSLISDNNRFADAAHNNLNTPDNVVYKGERFGYDYVANVNTFEAFAQGEYKLEKIEFMAGLKGVYTAFWRTGNMRNGVHANDSYGDSETSTFFTYSTKAAITYKISGRHYLVANVAYQTDAPTFRNSFQTSRTSNALINGLTPVKTFSTDLSYFVRMPNINGRVAAFYNTINDGLKVTNIYIDGLDGGEYGSYILKNIDRKQYGAELGAEIKVTQTLTATLGGGIGNYFYSNRPTIQMISDNGAKSAEELSYIKNFKVGGFPQTAGSFGLEYRGKQYWFAGASINYFDHIFVDVYPSRRTESVLAGYTTDHNQWWQFINQEQLDSQFTVDFFVGKSFKFKQYYLNVNFSVNNALNNTDVAIGGFEQYRVDTDNPVRYQNKYFYMYGAQYFLNVNFRF